MIYLHLINDEKFTEFAIRIFEECNPGKNVFLISVPDPKVPLKYIRAGKNVIVRKRNTKDYIDTLNRIDHDVLVVHMLNWDKVKTLSRIKNGSKKIWISWGMDIYNTPFYKKNIFQPLTRKAVQKINNRPGNFLKSKAEVFFKEFTSYFYKQKSRKALRASAINSFDFCAPVLPEEMEVLESWDFFRAQFVPFEYISLETDFGADNLDVDEEIVLGRNILVGNSMYPSSNHLDAMKMLHELGVENSLILPMNYGIELEYRDDVITEGKKMFGDRFRPLVEFMPKASYLEILKSCGVAIMNHDRQQAIGNIVMLLWLGCKIFFSEAGLAYSFFKNKGFAVFSVQKDLSKKEIHKPLTQKEIKTNRTLLIQEYGYPAVVEKVESLVKTVNASR
jgi:hypothetical protein